MLHVAMISVHTCPLASLGSRETGGMNVYVRKLSEQLGLRGVAVDVFTRRQDTTTPEIVEFSENARVIHLAAGPPNPMDKYDVLEHLTQFTEGIEEFRRRSGCKYHIVHSHYWLSGQVALELARKWKTPLVAMFHTLGRLKNNVSRDESERENAVRIDIERELLRTADRVVAASPTDMENMLEYYGAPASRIKVIPGGVDLSVFRPFSRDAARAILDLGPEKLVLFVGRIQPLKGIDLLLNAYALLLDEWKGDSKPRLMVVGGDNLADAYDPEAVELARLREIASELGIEKDVIFRGAVSHDALPTYYAAADVVVVPSLYESFGLVALEAMACGTPVVASRVGGLQWTVRDAESGYLVDSREPEGFAAAISSLLRDEGLRRRMSKGAVRVAKDYSWGTAADRTLDLYSDLIPLSTCSCACCSGI